MERLKAEYRGELDEIPASKRSAAQQEEITAASILLNVRIPHERWWSRARKTGSQRHIVFSKIKKV